MTLEEAVKLVVTNKSPVKKVNEVDDIKEFPDEARRQIMNFQKNIHRKDWAETNYEGEEPKQDTAKRDAFHKQHGLRILPNTAPEEHPEEVARHLDYYHHFHPNVAKSFNMEPMTRANSEKVLAAADVSYKAHLAKKETERKASKVVDLKPKGSGITVKENPKDPSNPFVKLDKETKSVFDGMKRDNNKSNYTRVVKFRREHPEHNDKDHDSAYPHYKKWQEYSGSMITPMDKSKFHRHWATAKNVSGLRDILKTSVKKTKNREAGVLWGKTKNPIARTSINSIIQTARSIRKRNINDISQ